jgi:hypothetical protein
MIEIKQILPYRSKPKVNMDYDMVQVTLRMTRNQWAAAKEKMREIDEVEEQSLIKASVSEKREAGRG